MSEAFGIVRAGYDRIGPRYREWSQHSPVRLRWVEHLLSLLPEDSVVIELGCGSGEPATRLLADRHRVVGVEASYQQVRLAQTAAPQALLVQADLTRLVVAEESVDAVAMFYVLGHVPAAEHAPLLQRIAGWLRPGGVLLTSAPLGGGDDVEDDWLGVPMFFGGIGEEATRKALVAAGLSVETWEVVEEDEGHGRVVRFLWLVARKPTGSSHFAAGEVVLRREVLNGQLWMQSPVRVVADTPDCLAVVMRPGSPFEFCEHPTPHPWAAHTAWSGTTVLQLHRPGESYGAWKFFDEEGRFTHWYLNFDEPVVKHLGPVRCYDTDDHGIDLVLPAEGGWHWKDHDEPQAFVAEGRFSQAKADEVMRYAHSVAAQVEDGLRWWSAWDGWRP